MRKALLVLAVLLVPGAALAADWQAVAEKTRESIVYINSADGSCTGFVIDADAKGDTDRILTAAHCDSEPGHPLFADSAIARVIWKNAKADLMILEVADTGRPAINVGKKNPKTGEEIASYGFGMALERPMLRTAHVADEAAVIPDVEGGPFVMIDAAYVGGQSGGPCINAAGEVVSIVQRASNLIGIGVGAETIRDKVGRYLPKPKS
jgi:S1-C subfamily serine protease